MVLAGERHVCCEGRTVGMTPMASEEPGCQGKRFSVH